MSERVVAVTTADDPDAGDHQLATRPPGPVGSGVSGANETEVRA